MYRGLDRDYNISKLSVIFEGIKKEITCYAMMKHIRGVGVVLLVDQEYWHVLVDDGRMHGQRPNPIANPVARRNDDDDDDNIITIIMGNIINRA